LHQIFRRIARGAGKQEDVDLLVSLANGMAPGKTICALSDAAAIPTHAAIKNFRADFEQCIALGRDPHGPTTASAPAMAESH
jgi:NADH-quinone oxidoreductase subunit F